jgi:hypothetical protein
LCVYDSSFACIVSLSSLSLSSEKKKRNKAKATPQPTTGPYVYRGRLYYNAEAEIPIFKDGYVGEGQYFLAGASGLKNILFANMDERIKGKGPGTYACTEGGRHGIKDSLDDASIIVFGRRVSYAEMMHSLDAAPKSPAAPVTEDDFEDEEVEVGKA